MPLKVTFPAGSNVETVRGLYQWDYGRVLEIESVDIGSEIGVEIHFACPNMNEAIVRSCTFIDGIGSVTIPNACLEQTGTITAWIYQIYGTEGHTCKTINLPVTARTRPSASHDIPAEVINRYTELIAEVEEAVDALVNGNVTAAKATNATNANYARSANEATSANFATTAQIAQYASADTSKGTIEARLSALAIKKEGVVVPVTDSAQNVSVTKNSIQRQGNFVIGQFAATGQFIAYADSITGAYILPICTVPEEYRPSTQKTFYGYVKSVNTGGGAYTSAGTIVILPSGSMRFTNDVVKSGCVVTEVFVNFGYDATK